jgi:hypothetical protein
VRSALRQAGGSVKLAVLLLQGCNREEATTILDRAGGRLRVALASIGRENLLPAEVGEIPSPPMHDSTIDD